MRAKWRPFQRGIRRRHTVHLVIFYLAKWRTFLRGIIRMLTVHLVIFNVAKWRKFPRGIISMLTVHLVVFNLAKWRTFRRGMKRILEFTWSLLIYSSKMAANTTWHHKDADSTPGRLQLGNIWRPLQRGIIRMLMQYTWLSLTWQNGGHFDVASKGSYSTVHLVVFNLAKWRPFRRGMKRILQYTWSSLT